MKVLFAFTIYIYSGKMTIRDLMMDHGVIIIIIKQLFRSMRLTIKYYKQKKDDEKQRCNSGRENKKCS